MKLTYNIPELIALSSNVRYFPGLNLAVNRLITARNGNDYKVALKEATEIVLGYQVTEGEKMKDYGYQDKAFFAGVPIFQPFILKSDESGVDDLYLPAAVISLNWPKNIVTTVVQGRDNSVMEFINDGDAQITVSGIIWDRGWKYPMEQVAAFHEFMKKKKPLEVEHEILNGVGIFQVVVTDRSLQQTPHINCQAYSFTCISDEPLPLMINDIPANL